MPMDSTNNSVANETCTIASYRGALVHGSFPFAVCIILILSVIQRTKKPKQPGRSSNSCRDLFSLIYPIDLFDNHDRVPHCLAFGAASSMVLDLFFGDYQSYFFGLDIPGWSKILVGSIVTIEIAIDCFPFFACITCKSRILANGMGFLYLTAWFSMLILISVGCGRLEHDDEAPYLFLVPQIPVLICILLLAFYFLYMFITILIQRHKGLKLTNEEKLYKSHQAIYVKNLFNKPKEVVYTGWRGRLFKNYKPHPGFIYPTRVLMPCFVSVIGLYQVSFWIIPLGLDLIEVIIGVLNSLAVSTYQNLNETEVLDDITMKLNQAHTGLQVSWAIASALSICLPLMYIPQILKNYRKHLLSMWSGNHKLPTHVQLQSVKAIVGSLKYIGFQVAVFLTGYMFIQVILFVFIGGLSFYILACIWDFQSFFVEIFLQLLIPSMIIGISVMSSQDLFVKLFFIQDKLNPNDNDRPLALQHRVWFLIYCYVAMFLNLLFGLILAVIRVVIGLLISIFLLPRIDRPIWVPGFGDKDLVYAIYVGNLYTEHAHSNPILITFCHIMVFDVLKPQRKRLKLQRLNSNLLREGLVNRLESTGSYSDLESVGNEKESSHLLKYFRWHLAYTLIKNPSLIELRKGSAILPDQEVVISDGEAKFVNAGEGKGEQQNNQMLPHILQVMKRQSLIKKMSNLDTSTAVVEMSVNPVEPGLIVLEDSPEQPHPSSSDTPLVYQMPSANAVLPMSDMLPVQDLSQSVLQSDPMDDAENRVISRPGDKGSHTANFESNA